MNTEARCPNCGSAISPTARFCADCGAALEAATQASAEEAPTEAIPPEPATEAGPTESTARAVPNMAEFGELLRDYSQLPGVQMAVIAALIGGGVVLAAGFLLSVLIPSASLAHFGLDEGSDLFRETMGQASTTTLATADVVFADTHFALRSAPLLFALFPIGGCALGASVLTDRTASMPTVLRYGWGAAIGVPFALLMLLISLLAGTLSEESGSISPSEGSVFLLSLLWGTVGGMAGVAWASRGLTPGPTPATWIGRALITAREGFRPLGVSLLVLAAVGVGVWTVQTVRDAAEARGDRSLATTAVDNVLFAGDLGYRYQALGSGAEFELFNSEVLQTAISSALESDEVETEDDDTSSATFSPIPLSDSKVPDLVDAQGFDTIDAKYRIFDFGDVLPAWAFAPILLILIVVPALLALYAGFAIASANAASTLLQGAAWGAMIGPLWAAALALLTTLTQDIAFGQVDGDSLFVVTLLVGAAIGALGGLGAVRQRQAGPTH